MRTQTLATKMAFVRSSGAPAYRLACLLFCLAPFLAGAGPAAAEPRVTGYTATEPRGIPVFSAPPGAPVLIQGADLGNGGTVSFGSVPAADAINWSPTEILVIVPQAPTYPHRGPVAVIVGDQRAEGPAFTITAPQEPVTPPVSDGRIKVTNIASGETLRYPLAFLRGTVEGGGSEELQVINTSSRQDTGRFMTTLFRGQFKALVQLVPGANKIDLELADGSVTSLTLQYEPMTTHNIVRVIYLTDNTGDTRYPTQKPDDPQDYQAKLATAALLWQTFTAERLNDRGLGRKTFRLDLNADGQVNIRTARAPKSAAYYQRLSGEKIWEELYGWVDQRFPTSYGKNLVIYTFARYDSVTKRTHGHTAIGGGGLALFSNLSLCSWPSSLQDVQRAFTDATRVDTTHVWDDSIGRSRLWALASTTVGVCLHELGHTFDLDHSSDPLCIMQRGHDYFNRFFTFYDPPNSRHSQMRVFRESEIPYFDSPRSKRLAAHRWFRPD